MNITWPISNEIKLRLKFKKANQHKQNTAMIRFTELIDTKKFLF